MNLTKILAHFGLGDGLGNTSSTRMVMMLIVLAVLSPKIILAIKSGVLPEWTTGDMEMLGIAFGAKLVQNSQENPKPTELPTETKP